MIPQLCPLYPTLYETLEQEIARSKFDRIYQERCRKVKAALAGNCDVKIRLEIFVRNASDGTKLEVTTALDISRAVNFAIEKYCEKYGIEEVFSGEITAKVVLESDLPLKIKKNYATDWLIFNENLTILGA